MLLFFCDDVDHVWSISDLNIIDILLWLIFEYSCRRSWHGSGTLPSKFLSFCSLLCFFLLLLHLKDQIHAHDVIKVRSFPVFANMFAAMHGWNTLLHLTVLDYHLIATVISFQVRTFQVDQVFLGQVWSLLEGNVRGLFANYTFRLLIFIGADIVLACLGEDNLLQIPKLLVAELARLVQDIFVVIVVHQVPKLLDHIESWAQLEASRHWPIVLAGHELTVRSSSRLNTLGPALVLLISILISIVWLRILGIFGFSVSWSCLLVIDCNIVQVKINRRVKPQLVIPVNGLICRATSAVAAAFPFADACQNQV